MAGRARGRRLVAPPGSTVRPTTDRVREAVFNALGSLGRVEGDRVLDLFAGSGALGIEALSRGAASVTFVDADRAARRAVEANLRTTGLGERAQVVADDALRYLEGHGPWDLVLLDPPYGFDRWEPLLTAVAERLSPEGVVVVESDRPVPLPEGFEVHRQKRYGSTVVLFAQRTPPAATEVRPSPGDIAT